ncbi:hypothetical protein [Metabacillus sp. B2-18]|uniref:hypothetical protein n=1 Tax=Metabacillus sp. B2-18 TaxID=2897333 RepID=UPI001E2F28B5|nr:hypothetical protein [Metabacillus sp. B2-18]UGB31724.1 hypothetical protein LPC09_04370 [Metabacillus sp. B2-18]
MGKDKFVKSVHFNLKNENDSKINKHIARRNFSGYVKKLILEDIKKKEVEKGAIKQAESKKENINIKQPKPIQKKQTKQNINSPLINLPKK